MGGIRYGILDHILLDFSDICKFVPNQNGHVVVYPFHDPLRVYKELCSFNCVQPMFQHPTVAFASVVSAFP